MLIKAIKYERIRLNNMEIHINLINMKLYKYLKSMKILLKCIMLEQICNNVVKIMIKKQPKDANVM